MHFSERVSHFSFSSNELIRVESHYNVLDGWVAHLRTKTFQFCLSIPSYHLLFIQAIAFLVVCFLLLCYEHVHLY